MRVLAVAALAMLLGGASVSAANLGACAPLLDHKVNTLQGGLQSLCDFQGKVLLIVNTASFCGYTGQYEGLETLYGRYKDQGFVVLGFPSNDFGQQEPGDNRQIASFCERTYQVRFPLFEKSGVTGPNSIALFRQLALMAKEAPQWNFHKYLVDRSGTKVLAFRSTVTPDDPGLAQQIERLLKD
jgi:glutathione peroxidase